MKNEIIKGEGFYKKRDSLREIRVDNVNWITYYIDDASGEKWAEEYPHAERQGGGPPQLRLIEKFPWE